MSFDSVKNTVNKEEISYLFQKDKTFDHIILTEKKHTDIIRMLSDLSELHVDPVLKRGILTIESDTFNADFLLAHIKTVCAELDLRESIVDELLKGVTLPDRDAEERILENYSMNLYEKDAFGDIEDLVDIIITLLRHTENEKHVLLFKAESTDVGYSVYLKAYYLNHVMRAQINNSCIDYIEQSNDSFLYDIVFSVPSVISPDFRIEPSAVDLTAATLLKMGKQSKAEDHMHTISNSPEIADLFLYANTFLQVTGYINYLQLNPEAKERTSKKKPSYRSTSKAKPNGTGTSVKNIELNGIHFSTRNDSVARKLRSHTVQHLTDCWNVRGHYRRYKNGKVIYIAPYEKGPERNNKNGVQKNYTL